MKKFTIFVVAILFLCVSINATIFDAPQVNVSSQKLMKAGWWGYDALATIAAESGKVFFIQSAPISVAEIKSYLVQIDYEILSESGKKLYDEILQEFKQTGLAFKSDLFKVTAGLSFNPELYYKTNSEIDWSFNYYFKDNILSAPISFDFADCALIQTDLFLGKNYWAIKNAQNFTNVPLGYNDFEFLFPTNAYFSTGYQFSQKSGVSFQLGKSPLTIGNTLTGSVLLSEFYVSDFFSKINFYSPRVRYELTVIQQEVNKYFYLHNIQVKPFNRFQIGLIEGTFVNAPFELRFLNPLMLMHQMSPWTSYADYNNSTADGEFTYYGESRVCAYFGFTFDWALSKNIRIYGLYAQNELQIPPEMTSDHGKMFPDSLGGQLGIDMKFPSKKQGYWSAMAEVLYTTPWLYIKHDPAWSLYRARNDNMTSNGPICTWVGTPLGPDSIAAQVKFGYDLPSKWNVELLYTFAAQGENSFNLFYKDGTWDPSDYYDAEKDEYTYYPVAGNQAGEYTDAEAVEISRNRKTPTGIPQYTNTVAINCSYKFKSWLLFSLRISYNAIINDDHIENNFQQGLEVALSSKIEFLK